jgi:hypothetical protein
VRDALAVGGADADNVFLWGVEEPIMSNPASTLVGEVEELWRYPVKSMIGEPLTAT